MTLVLNISSNLWSGFGFLLLDLLLIGLIFELTTRLASLLNRRRLLRAQPVHCEDITLPLVGGGLATHYGWVFAVMRGTALLCVLAFEFSGRGRTRSDVQLQPFQFRFGEAGMRGESDVDDSTLNLLPAYRGRCAVPVGQSMQLFEGVIFADESGRGKLDSLICLDGVDSPTERFLLEYDLIQKDLSLGMDKKQDGLFGWQPQPGKTKTKVDFERRLTSLGAKDRDFRGSMLVSYCMNSVSDGEGACLVLLEAEDGEKFLFPQVVNRSSDGALAEDWSVLHGLTFRGNISHGVARAAERFIEKYKKNRGLDLHDKDLAIDLLNEMVSVRKINESELIYTGTSENLTEIEPFGLVAAGVLVVTVVGLFGALVYLRGADGLNGVASYNELAELVVRYGGYKPEEGKARTLHVVLQRGRNSENVSDEDLIFAIKTV